MMIHIPDELIPAGKSAEQVQREVVAALLGRWAQRPNAPQASEATTSLGSLSESAVRVRASHLSPEAHAGPELGGGAAGAQLTHPSAPTLSLADSRVPGPSDPERRSQQEALLAPIRGARGWELLTLLGEIPGMDTVEDPFPRQQDVAPEIHFD